MKKGAIGTLSFLVASTLLMTSCGQTSGGSGEKKSDLTKNLVTVKKATSPDKVPAAAKNRKDTLIIGITKPKGKFNPIYAETTYDNIICETMFDSLVENDPSGKPVASLAKSWKISDDGLKYTFNLRDDVKFTDGTPLTAEDVAFTYTVICDSAYDGAQDVPSMNLKGYEEYNKGTATSVEGIKVVDKNTIEFTTTKINATNIYNFGGIGILEKAYYGKDYKQGNTDALKALMDKPQGSGQYKFVNYKPGQEVDLEANTNFWKGKPKIKNVIFKTTTPQTMVAELKTGNTDIDMLQGKPDELQQVMDTGFMNVYMFPSNSYTYIGMNLKKDTLSDVKVRQALAYGLNRKTVINTANKQYGEVINAPQTKASWAYEPDVEKYEFNPKKANQLLDEAGWKKGSDGYRVKDGKKLTIHFSATSDSNFQKILIPVMIANYKDIGVELIAEYKDFNTIVQDTDSGNFEMFSMGWSLTADPDQASIFKSTGSQNYGKYNNPDVDKLFDEGIGTTDQAKRAKAYKAINKQISKDLPYIFLDQYQDMWCVSSRVKNFEASPMVRLSMNVWKFELK